MKTRGWKGSLVAAGAALLLVGAGIALAKPHQGKGPHGNGKGKGHENAGKPDGPAGDPGGHGKGRGGGACDALAVDGVRAFVDTTCPCAGLDDGAGGTIAWKNHGRYVRCVTRALRDGLRAAGLKRRCLRGIVPCAAQSACGKGGAIACIVTTTGTCVSGSCSNDPQTSCTLDVDCAIPACSVTSGEECTALGGVAGSGSCCTSSVAGAFLN